MTALSRVVDVGVGDIEHSFALIPAQTDYAQVYLNQYLPRCGDPPPVVTLTVRFQYQFTGASEACTIEAHVNRNPSARLLEIIDDGESDGIWQSYEGSPVEVQLTYDPLFTIELVCAKNTPNVPAILVTNVSVY